jgi:hypothetical protein
MRATIWSEKKKKKGNPTEKQEFDIFGRLDAIFFEVLFDEFGTGNGRPLLCRHGATHFR